MDKLKQKISFIEVSPETRDLDYVMHQIIDVINLTVNETIPEVDFSNKSTKICPWYSDEIKKHLRLKDKLLKKYKTSGSLNDLLAFKKQRNITLDQIWKQKSTYYCQKIDNNPKKLFKNYREIVGENSKNASRYPTPKDLKDYLTSIDSQLAKNFETQANFFV